MISASVLAIFVLLSAVYYTLPVQTTYDSEMFLTIASFLFAIFVGFFISRQGDRYSKIQELISEFDGNMSAMYRSAGHLVKSVQPKIQEIITNHYSLILKHRAWDYHFTHKSTTLISLHQLLEKTYHHKEAFPLEDATFEEMIDAIREAQIIRKKMISLHQEHIPLLQWAIILILTMILLIALSLIPSVGNLYPSILKSAFGVSILATLILLYQFDRLRFVEKTMGENSARDILNIFSGKR